MRFLLIVLLSLSLAAPVHAQAPGGPEGHGPPPPHEIIRQHAVELGLDAVTADRIRAIAEGGRAERQRLQTAVQAARAGLDGLLHAEEPDRAGIMAQVDRVGAAETAQLKHQLTVLLDIRAQLTPAQRAAVETLLAHQGPPGGGPPPAGGPPPGLPPAPPMGGLVPGL